MTEGYQGCIFLNSSRPRQAETKGVKGKEGQGEGKWEGEGEKKESNRLNIAIFLIIMCIFNYAVHLCRSSH